MLRGTIFGFSLHPAVVISYQPQSFILGGSIIVSDCMCACVIECHCLNLSWIRIPWGYTAIQDNVIVDFDCNRIPGIYYVGLSRVRNLENMYITNLNEDKITVSQSVITEMQRLRTTCRLIVKEPLLWNKTGGGGTNAGSTCANEKSREKGKKNYETLFILVLGTSFHGTYEYVLLYSDFEGATV